MSVVAYINPNTGRAVSASSSREKVPLYKCTHKHNNADLNKTFFFYKEGRKGSKSGGSFVSNITEKVDISQIVQVCYKNTSSPRRKSPETCRQKQSPRRKSIQACSQKQSHRRKSPETCSRKQSPPICALARRKTPRSTKSQAVQQTTVELTQEIARIQEDLITTLKTANKTAKQPASTDHTNKPPKKALTHKAPLSKHEAEILKVSKAAAEIRERNALRTSMAPTSKLPLQLIPPTKHTRRSKPFTGYKLNTDIFNTDIFKTDKLKTDKLKTTILKTDQLHDETYTKIKSISEKLKESHEKLRNLHTDVRRNLRYRNSETDRDISRGIEYERYPEKHPYIEYDRFSDIIGRDISEIYDYNIDIPDIPDSSSYDRQEMDVQPDYAMVMKEYIAFLKNDAYASKQNVFDTLYSLFVTEYNDGIIREDLFNFMRADSVNYEYVKKAIFYADMEHLWEMYSTEDTRLMNIFIEFRNRIVTYHKKDHYNHDNFGTFFNDWQELFRKFMTIDAYPETPTSTMFHTIVKFMAGRRSAYEPDVDIDETHVTGYARRFFEYLLQTPPTEQLI